VTKDYAGFDTASGLDRPGVFRLNLHVGRDVFTKLFGFTPPEFAERRDEFDFAAVDRIIPHPAYGRQAWGSVVAPGADSEQQIRQLIVHAYERATRHHRRGQQVVEDRVQSRTDSSK